MKFSKILKVKIVFFLSFFLISSSFFRYEKEEESLFEKRNLVEKQIKSQNQIHYAQWIKEVQKEKKYHQEKQKPCRLKTKEKKIACINSQAYTLSEYKKSFDYQQRYIANNSFLSFKNYFDTYIENQILYMYMKEKNLLSPIKNSLIERTIIDADVKFFLQKNYKNIKEKEYQNYYKQMSFLLKKAPKWKNLKYEDRKNIKFNYKKTLFYNKLKQEYRIQKNDEWEDKHIQLFIEGKYKKKDENKWIFKISYSEDKKEKQFIINIKMLDSGLKDLLSMKNKKTKAFSKGKKGQVLRKEYLDYFLFEKLAKIYFKTQPLFKETNYKHLSVFLKKIFQIHLFFETLKNHTQKKKRFLEQIKEYKEKKNIYTYDANLLN